MPSSTRRSTLSRLAAFALCAVASSAPGLVFKCGDAACARYSLVDSMGTPLLSSAGALAVRVGSAWATEANGGLVRIDRAPTSWAGEDAAPKGAFVALNISFALEARLSIDGLQAGNRTGLPFVAYMPSRLA